LIDMSIFLPPDPAPAAFEILDEASPEVERTMAVAEATARPWEMRRTINVPGGHVYLSAYYTGPTVSGVVPPSVAPGAEAATEIAPPDATEDAPHAAARATREALDLFANTIR
jgi:hypothetical protein